MSSQALLVFALIKVPEVQSYEASLSVSQGLQETLWYLRRGSLVHVVLHSSSLPRGHTWMYSPGRDVLEYGRFPLRPYQNGIYCSYSCQCFVHSLGCSLTPCGFLYNLLLLNPHQNNPYLCFYHSPLKSYSLCLFNSNKFCGIYYSNTPLLYQFWPESVPIVKYLRLFNL